jgi:class 3 adenylate cyclase/tetratricopeptide (TPR) repeat protein
VKCLKCQFVNREGAKFCLKCGEKLEIKCSKCGKHLPVEAIFCDACGHKLSLPSEAPPKDLSFDEKLTKIQRYLPKGLTEKILSQKEKIEGERKQVTVMFCDLEGFTQFSQRIGPEEAYAVMDQVYEILIHKVHHYEGTVNEFTGDGIMALFGAPIALEDAPQRAIHAAHAIHREMAKFSVGLKQKKKIASALKMRIGIHTGPVVVGTLGNDLRVEFKAVGDTVNMASRVENLAESGTTYVTEATFKLTEGLFRFEALGKRDVKGKIEAVGVYRAIAPSTRRTRFDVSTDRGLTPFVGRERELELLLDGFERTKLGRGQAFSIVAEAGVGKSRLLYEFRKAVAHQDVTFLEGRCLSYSKGVAYHLQTDILKANFNIIESDRDSEIRAKVIKGLKILKADEPSTLPYLLEILGVKDSGIDQILISPEARKDRIIEALKRIVYKGSEIRTLILAYEDLHWMDKSSEDVLKNSLDYIPGGRVLFIFTYRPEFVPSWGGKSYHNQLTLNRLSNRESLAMVAYLLGTDSLDEDLENLILEKAEGIPFFIEEFVRSLKDLKLLAEKGGKYWLAKDYQDVTIPSTIQDVIMARVDSLPENAKDVLQTGSVIEREFDYRLIKRVTDLPEQELLSSLSILKEAELIYERGIYPETTYIFKHALTREVVYDSLLTKRKKKLHEKIGNAIEDLNKENIGEFYGVLAGHFIESWNYERGAEYCQLSGKKAVKAGSYRDAIEYAKKRVLCLERLPKTDATQRKIIDARTVLAGYYMSLSRLVDAKEAVTPIVDLALALNHQRRLPGIHVAIGLYSLWGEEDNSKGFRQLNEVFKIAEKVDDELVFYMPLWFANYYLGATLSFNCEFEGSLEYLKKCMDLSKLANDLVGIPFAKGVICLNYVFQGKIDAAYKIGGEALQVAKEIGGMFVKGMAYTAYGVSCYFKGFFDEAESKLLKGSDYCEKTTQAVWGPWAPFSLGHMYCDMGKYERATGYYQKAISILEPGRILPSWVKMFEVATARAKALNRDQGINLSELFKYYKDNKHKVFEGWAARYIGEILLNIDDSHISEAEDWVKKAIKADKRNRTKWSLGGDYALYAELFKRKGNLPKAGENLSKAIEIFKECSADGWVKKYEKELAAIS